MSLVIHIPGTTNSVKPGACLTVTAAEDSAVDTWHFETRHWTGGEFVAHDSVGLTLHCLESGRCFAAREPIPVHRVADGQRLGARRLQVLMTADAEGGPAPEVSPQLVFFEGRPGAQDARRVLDLALSDWWVRPARRHIKAKPALHAIGFDFGTSHVGIAYCLDRDGRENYVLSWDPDSKAAGHAVEAGVSRRSVPLPVEALGRSERHARRGYQPLPTEILIFRHLIPGQPRVSIFGADAERRRRFKTQYFSEIKKLVDNPEYSSQTVWFGDRDAEGAKSKAEALRNLPTPCLDIPQYYFQGLVATLGEQYELSNRLVVTVSFTSAFTEAKRREFLAAIARGFRMPVSRVHAIEESYSDSLAWLAHPIFTRGQADGHGVMRENNELLRALFARQLDAAALERAFPVAQNKAERRALAQRAGDQPPHPGAYVQTVTFNMGGGTTDLSSHLFPIDATHHARYFTAADESVDEAHRHESANPPIRPVCLGQYSEPFIGGTFQSWQLSELLKYRLLELAVTPEHPRHEVARRFLMLASALLDEAGVISERELLMPHKPDQQRALRAALAELLSGAYAFHHPKSHYWEHHPREAASDREAMFADTEALLSAFDRARKDPQAAHEFFAKKVFHPKTVARYHHSNDHHHLMFRFATDDITLARANALIRAALQTNYGFSFDGDGRRSAFKRGLSEALLFVAERIKRGFAFEPGERLWLGDGAKEIVVDRAALTRSDREDFQQALLALAEAMAAFARGPRGTLAPGVAAPTPAELETLFCALGLQRQAVLRTALVPLAGALHNALDLFRADESLDLPRPRSFRRVFEQILERCALLFGPQRALWSDGQMIVRAVSDLQQGCADAARFLRQFARAHQRASTAPRPTGDHQASYGALKAQRDYLIELRRRLRRELAGQTVIDRHQQAKLRHTTRLLAEVEGDLARIEEIQLKDEQAGEVIDDARNRTELERIEFLLGDLSTRVGRLWNHPQGAGHDDRLFWELWTEWADSHEGDAFRTRPEVRAAFDEIWALARHIRRIVMENPAISLYTQAFDENVPPAVYREREGRLYKKVLVLAGQGSGFALVAPLIEALTQYHIALGNEGLRKLEVVSDFTAGAGAVASLRDAARDGQAPLRRKLSGAVGCLYHANFLLSGKNYIQVAPTVRTLRLEERVMDGGEWPDQLLVPPGASHGTRSYLVHDDRRRPVHRIFVVWKHLPTLDRPWGVGEHLSLFVVRGHPDCLGIFRLGTLSGAFTGTQLYLTCQVARQDSAGYADTRYIPMVYQTSETHPDEPGELLSHISQEYGVAVTLPGWRFLAARREEFHNFVEEPFLILRPGSMPLLRDIPDMQILESVKPLRARTLAQKIYQAPNEAETTPRVTSLTQEILAGFRYDDPQVAASARRHEQPPPLPEPPAPVPTVFAREASAPSQDGLAPPPGGHVVEPAVVIATPDLLDDTDPEGLDPLLDFNPTEAWRQSRLPAKARAAAQSPCAEAMDDTDAEAQGWLDGAAAHGDDGPAEDEWALSDPQEATDTHDPLAETDTPGADTTPIDPDAQTDEIEPVDQG